MLTERQITLCRVAIFLRMDAIKDRNEPELYAEHKIILNELWALRLAMKVREMKQREAEGEKVTGENYDTV